MQGANLAWHDSDDQPLIADFKQDDPFSRPKGNATDDLHASLAESFTTRYFACQPCGSCQQRDD